jgi:8-oxo-dGTP diphosphatase
LEFGEDLVEAVRREVREEYAVHTRHIRNLGARSVLREHNGYLTHWVAVVFDALVDHDEVRLGEPEKMAELGWFTLENLPAPLHSQLRSHLSLLAAAPQPRMQRRARYRRAINWLSRHIPGRQLRSGLLRGTCPL